MTNTPVAKRRHRNRSNFQEEQLYLREERLLRRFWRRRALKRHAAALALLRGEDG